MVDKQSILGIVHQYALDLFKNPEAWQNWEYRHAGSRVWSRLTDHPTWHSNIEYRKNPKLPVIDNKAISDYARILMYYAASNKGKKGGKLLWEVSDDEGETWEDLTYIPIYYPGRLYREKCPISRSSLTLSSGEKIVGLIDPSDVTHMNVVYVIRLTLVTSDNVNVYRYITSGKDAQDIKSEYIDVTKAIYLNFWHETDANLAAKKLSKSDSLVELFRSKHGL